MLTSFDPPAGLKAPTIHWFASAVLAVAALATLAWSSQARADSGPLSLEDAVWRALDEAPQIAASVATLEAAQAVRPSAGRLPDPELVSAVDNLPVNTSDRFSLTRDFMT
ncbi:MAG: TolC family protein, partial [Steroidobacteraceae bacterium]